MVTKNIFNNDYDTFVIVILMKSVLDDLDRRILLQLCNGIYSYSELADKCGVGRNTIYRRISRLEAEKIIDKKVRAVPNFTRLNLSAICIMMDVAQSDVERLIKFLKRQRQVKFLWKTFGAYNITVVIICSKGEEGNCISNLREVLEKMKINLNKFEAAISFTWEKIDLCPY